MTAPAPRRRDAGRLIGLRQLLIGLSLAGIVPLAIVATVLLVALWRAQQAELYGSMRATAHALAASLEERAPAGIETAALPELMRTQLREPSSIALIAAPDGRIVARTPAAEHAGASLEPALAAAVQARPSGVGRFALSDQTEVYGAWTPVGGTRWTLVLAMPAAPADATLSRSLGALAALLVIVLVASGVFAWLIGRRLAGAIHAAADAAVAMSAGRPAPPVVSRIDEVQTLMQALERASARLGGAQEDRQRAALELDAVLQQETTARVQAEAANRAKDEFLAMLGHELRNPLGAIGNAIRVIDRLPSTSADHKAARDIIARQAAHLAKIVDDLLDVGRVVSGRILLRRNLVDLAQAAAAGVATMRAAEPRHDHEWKLELETVLVSADPTRVDQVLANLLGNAAKFTPPGGEIRVRVKDEAGEALLCVEDSGPGVRPELLPYLFEPFTRDPALAERGGLGIGLALVKRLVELHGGSVHAENVTAQGGARFTVRLPAIPEPEPVGQRNARPLPAPRPARPARVLIVEDNDDSRVSLQRVLQADGHLVSAARDARAGLDAAAAGSPNVAIVDIGLPGTDGYQFARQLRERLGSRVRLIALTGYGTEADRKRAAEAGFDAHLTKPVDLDRLLALITESAG